jgi:hypothetical protein
MSAKHAELLFSPRNLDEGLVSEAPALFKVGVRTCRLFFSMLLGFSRPPAYATHDFRLLSNDPRGGGNSGQCEGAAHKTVAADNPTAETLV